MNGPSLASDEWSQRRLFGALWAERSRGQGTSRGLRPSCLRTVAPARLAAVLQPVALAPNVDRRRVMQQPVQDRRRDDRIAEDRSPVPVAFVGGQDDASAFISRRSPTERKSSSDRPREPSDHRISVLRYARYDSSRLPDTLFQSAASRAREKYALQA